MILAVILFSLLLVIIGIGASCYVLWRNNRTCAFQQELLNMASESARKAIYEYRFCEWEKPYSVLDKHTYESMLYSFKPLKLEAWFTEEEIKILKGDSHV